MKHGQSTRKNYKPIDNICFWFDAVTGTQYLLKQDVPKSVLQRCEYWDSLLEFRLYEELLKIYEPKLVVRQHLITIMPKEKPFKAWTWNIDFKINTPTPIYIEAKGKWIIDSMKAEGFWKNLRAVQHFHPKIWEQLLFIGSNKDDEWHLPQSLIRVHPMRELKELLNAK